MAIARFDAASIAGGVKDIAGTIIAVVMLIVAIRALVPKKKTAGGFKERFSEEMKKVEEKYKPLIQGDDSVEGRYNIADNMSVLYQKHKAGKAFISQRPFVMCVRNSMLRYLKSLVKKMSFKNGILIYSFWSGYRETEDMKHFLSECEKLGLKIVTLHTSGHADENTLKRLIETVNPKKLIPIHTENAERFKEIATNVVVEE